MKTTIEELALFGQSIWLDNISRTLLESGELKKLINQGLRGVTSNPSIFDKAISQSDTYDEKIKELKSFGKSDFEIYDELTVRDVQDALDLFKSVYENTKGKDGYVSLEIDPRLADDTAKTIAEGKRLWQKVNRPNLMLKVPATEAGYPAISELLSEGMNVNVTLIFSLEQYKKTQAAFIKGSPGKNVASVASVFVSRLDTAVDNLLKEVDKVLAGKAAVANCQLIYKQYLDTPEASRQRPLWASTSTKNPDYSDIKYATELIAKNTVNTLPDNTLAAYLDHGSIKDAMGANVAEAEKIITDLKASDIDVNTICNKLLNNGVAAFVTSFNSLLNTIEGK